MKPDRHTPPGVLLLVPSIGAVLGLVLVAGGSWWGAIPLMLGGMALVMVASGQPLRIPRLAASNARPDTSTSQPATAAATAASAAEQASRRPSRLAIAFMFTLGFAIGMVLDRIWTAAVGPSEATATSALNALLSAIRSEGLVETTVQVGDEAIIVAHSELDIGQAADILDGDFNTLMRGKAANPFIFEVRYPRPRQARAVVLDLATMDDYEITLTVTRADGQAFAFREEGTTRLVDPSIEFSFPVGPQVIRKVRVEILDRRPPPQEGFHTHVRGFSLR